MTFGNKFNEFGDPKDRTGFRAFSYNLLFSVPVLAVYSAIQDYYDRREAFDDHFDVLVCFVLTTILHVGIIGLSIDAGSDFYSLQSNAVAKTKRFLYLFIGYWFLVCYLPLFIYLPDSFKETMRFRIIGLSGVIAYFVGWSFRFLNRSAAVHKLFGTKEESDYTPPVA